VEWRVEWGVERDHPEGVLISYVISRDFLFLVEVMTPPGGFASDAKGRGAPPSTSGSRCNLVSLGRWSPDEGSVKSTATPWSLVARVGVCIVASITHMSCFASPGAPGGQIRGLNMVVGRPMSGRFCCVKLTQDLRGASRTMEGRFYVVSITSRDYGLGSNQRPGVVSLPT